MKSSNTKKILYVATVLVILAAIGIIFFNAPVPINPGERGTYTDSQGQVQYISTDAQWINYLFSFHIAYFHISIALTAYLAFLLVFIFSILYLIKGKQEWDIKAAASAEVGVLFGGLTLITGSIWGGAAWGHYWPPGDVRLNTSLVLFFIYLAYLMIRQAVDSPEKQARLCAVFGVIGFISVPISFMSIRIWSSTTTHPTVLGPGGGGMTGSAVIVPMLLNVFAFVLLCISLIIYKVDNVNLREELMAAKDKKGV
ncbi:MAG: cytochrome c biogenesis protein [ANME-2 cluster archaeon]|nr:cytochrome c biogenesis protein [ANME-2 cluster archaeon]